MFPGGRDHLVLAALDRRDDALVIYETSGGGSPLLPRKAAIAARPEAGPNLATRGAPPFVLVAGRCDAARLGVSRIAS